MMDLSVHLEAFDGPLDLLLHLIDKNKVSIYDIPIAEITDQYLDYLKKMQEADLDIMSEFLVMASTLLDLKAKMLLPREKNEEGEEIDPRQDLVEQLLQYKMYRYISGELGQMMDSADQVFFREPTIPEEVRSYEEPVDVMELTKDLSLSRLEEIFSDVLKRSETRVDPVRSSFGTIEKEEVSLDEKLTEVRSYAKSHRKFSFRQLLQNQHSRMQVIVTFLSILEMMRDGEIVTSQEKAFDDILIESKMAA